MSNYIDPDRERFGQFKALPREGVVHMLNLVRLNDVAIYDDGVTITGREAYQAYGRESAKIFKKVGGRVIWSGNFDLTLIGPSTEVWDICFIAEYPSAEAFITMVKDPDYQAVVHHRQRAVKTSRLIRLSPGTAGEGFG